MSSRLPRSPHVPHSTANTHPITASHAKSHVLAGVQDAYWSDDEDENLECPLCLEEMDLSDLHFKPCPCGYQICNFCWHHIKENLNGRCPACRREYTEQPAEFKSVTAEEQKRLNAQKRKRDKERKELEALNRRHLANVRIVQRNLVYVTGLGSRFAKEELLPSLRSSEYFGQYGKVSKILLVKRAATLNRPADVGVYITYHRREDAARAIAAVDGSPSPGGGGQIMRASYGTTKYCMNFLRGVQCTNNSCLDLHEWGDERDCFTKEDLATLKHAMKDSETRQAPAPASRKRAQDIDGTSAPPIGAALPRGASWGQNRGALPPAPAALPSSTSSGFPAITASLASSAQSSRQQRSSKARAAATERPATPGRNRRSDRNRERSGKSTEAATSVSAVPGGLAASRPSTPALSSPSSRPSTASRSPRDAFKSPALAAAQPTPLANVHMPAEDTATDTPSPETKEEDSALPVQSPPKLTPASPAMPPPPPGLSLPPPPPGLVAVPQHAPAQSVTAPQTSPSNAVPNQSQYQMSGAAKALLDDVRARREAAPPASTQQSPFPDFDRTLSNLTGGGFSFSFNMGSSAYDRSDVASGPYASATQDDTPGSLPGRGVPGFFDPFRKSDANSSLPPPPGLSAARPGTGYEQGPLSTHIEPKTSYTGAFNPFADGPGSLNRASSYDSERDAAERTSSRFGFARRQDSPGQVSSGYGAMVTSSPMRLYDQLPPEAPMSPPLATSTQWQYNHTTVDYGHQGMIPMNMTPNSMPQQLYVPPGLGQQHYNGMELNAAGLKELLNIGGNLSGARIDARRSQTDTFDARFVARPFSDPAIMSVAPREIFSTGPNLSQTHMPHLGPSTPGQPQANLAVFQSPPGIHALPVLSPPPGFAPPARPHPARQNTNPLTIGPMADSPMLTNASIIKSEPGSPTLSVSDFPALPPPSADTQTKRETNQPFLQPRVTAADAKAAVLAAKKASGVATKKAPSKPTIKTTTKSTTDDTPLTTSPLNPTGNIATHTETAPKSISASSGPASKDSVMDRPGKKASSQAAPKASTTTDSRSTPATSKPGSVEQSNAGSIRRKSNATLPSAGTAKSTTTPAPKPSILIPTPDPVEHVPILSRKQKKNKPVPPRPVVKLPKDESAKTESVTPSAPSSPVSTLLRFEDGSSPPTPLTAEPAMLPEPSIFGMLVELAAQYEIERLAFFDSQSYNTKLATPLRYGPLVQALSTLSMSGNPAPRSITPGTIDTAVTSFQQLLETLTQTISDMLRTLPRTTWDDTSPFDGVLKDMLKAEEFLEENTDDLPNWRDDDVTVLTQALEKRARWMEIQLVKLEELHRDINTSAVRSVLDQNDRGWGPRAREPRGESLASFEELGYVEQNGAKRAVSIAELEAALVGAREKETVAETELKEAITDPARDAWDTHDRRALHTPKKRNQPHPSPIVQIADLSHPQSEPRIPYLNPPWIPENPHPERLTLISHSHGKASAPRAEIAQNANRLIDALAHEGTLIGFSDGSQKDVAGLRRVGLGFSITWNGQEIESSSRGIGPKADNYDAEMLAIALLAQRCVAIAKERNIRKIHLFSDNQSAVATINSPKAHAAQYASLAFRKVAHTFLDEDPTRTFTVQWIPSHTRIPGNERADHLVNQGADSDPTPIFNCTATWLKSHATETARASWLEIWNAAEHSANARRFIPNPPSLKLNAIFVKDPPARPISSRLVQLITGHGFYGEYYARMPFLADKDPSCSCGEPIQTIPHLLFQCPETEDQRPTLTKVTPDLNPATLFGSLTGLSAVIRFIVYSGIGRPS